MPITKMKLVINYKTRPPRLYGLPKIHKFGNPLRGVSTCGSPTYELARYVAKFLQPYVGRTESFVKNSEHFFELLMTFLWNGDFYEQKSGTAMGSPVIANIFMEAFELEAIQSSEKKGRTNTAQPGR